MGKLLVDQIAHELKNYNLYKSFANFFSVEAIPELEEYYNKRAEEEKNHSEWIFKYLSEGDFKFVYPAVEKNTEKWEDYKQPFKDTVVREVETTEMIYKLVEQATKERDYMTFFWLQKLVTEQIEEENISRMAMTMMASDTDIYIISKQVLGLLS